MDLVHDRGSMDPVHESGPWTRSKVGVHGPLVHVLSSPLDSRFNTYTTKLINNSRKYRMLLLRQTIKTCQETLFDWLIIQSRFSLGHKTRLHCSLANPFPCPSTTRPNFFKSNLVSHLVHGYQDLAGQSS